MYTLTCVITSTSRNPPHIRTSRLIVWHPRLPWTISIDASMQRYLASKRGVSLADVIFGLHAHLRMHVAPHEYFNAGLSEGGIKSVCRSMWEAPSLSKPSRNNHFVVFEYILPPSCAKFHEPDTSLVVTSVATTLSLDLHSWALIDTPPNSILQSQHSGSNGTPRPPSFSQPIANGTGPHPLVVKF